MSRRKRSNHARFSLFVFQDIITCVMGIMLLLTLMMCLQITSVVASADAPPAAKMVNELKQQAAALAAEIAELESEATEQMLLLESGAIDDPDLLRNRSLTLKNENDLAKTDISGLWEQSVSEESVLGKLKKTRTERAGQITETRRLKQVHSELTRKLQEVKSGRRIVYNAHDSNSSSCWLIELTDETTFAAAELGKRKAPKKFQTVISLKGWIEQQHRQGSVFLLVVKPSAANVLDSLTDDLRKANVVFGFDLLPQEKTAIDPVVGAVVE